jgi:hypothetical protein
MESAARHELRVDGMMLVAWEHHHAEVEQTAGERLLPVGVKLRFPGQL